ncbi:MAG: 50S ribosomal protein L4 [Candidatus Woesebacteria bacterium GW2011_GWA1_45_8]|uniref:Large ribosomal subunit protein uL4 n=1 Tax=Candidatus Woesebacteria bacterium GW2011_GWA1_45_8 TaxID=1618559 RepID=A0A0G1QUH5_9BACT|nr:MAG: 50S ribosomal protein L4 [Candidatus Woesebacteria bacterium GW2011_GWA1_45_8]
MLKAQVISAKGIKSGQVSLPAFSEDKPNLFTLSQALRVYEDRSHQGLAKVQTRAEVNRTKKKVYRQKGTGGARHGSRSAPIYVGGGVAHGPRGVKRTLMLPQKIARKALKAAVSLKAKEGMLFVVSGAKSLAKTKDVVALLEKVGNSLGKKVTRATFVYSSENSTSTRAVGNIEGIKAVSFNTLNAHMIYFGGVILIDKDALDAKPKEKVQEQKVEAPKERKTKVVTTKKTPRRAVKKVVSKKK